MAQVKYQPLDEIRERQPVDPAKKTHGNDKLGKDEFLKLLMTQMKYQDPTAPADSQAFVAQLAQFSQLEMATNQQKTLESLLLSTTNQQQMQAVGLVGKDVLYSTDTVMLEQGRSVSMVADLARAATTVAAVITDENGKAVRTMQLGARAGGNNEVTWDGRDDRGNLLPPGAYQVRVTAADITGKSIAVDQQAAARVTGVSYETGVPELLLGENRIPMSNVIEVKERSTP
jgi:flagellar basal-body rod modification protein FlgD